MTSLKIFIFQEFQEVKQLINRDIYILNIESLITGFHFHCMVHNTSEMLIHQHLI